jgi:hypothetical protein
LIAAGRLERLINRHSLNPVAALCRVMTTCVVHENPPHDLRGDTEEMGPAPPVNPALIDESQVRLVDEGRRL